MEAKLSIEETEKSPMPTTVTELWDLCTPLWDKIAECTDKKARKELVAEYNKYAKEANKLQKRDTMVIITAQTKVMKSAEEDTTLHQQGKVVVRTAHVPQGMTGKTLAKKSSKRTQVITTTAESTPAPKKEGGGIVAQIITLHQQGKSNKEIIDMGFNKSTVNRQVGEYKKRNKKNE